VSDPALRVAINAQLVSFSQTYRNAGVSRYTYTLLDGLSHSNGNQRYTAFVSEAEARAAAHSPLGATGMVDLVPSTWPTARPPQRIAWEQVALPGELRRTHADVFHSPVNVLPQRLPCASVVTVHDLAFVHYPQYFRPARRLYQRVFTRRSVRAATIVLAVSESTKRDLVQHFGAIADHIRVVYTAIDPDFQPVRDGEALAAFRARHQLPQRYLLFLGTIEPRKNLLELLEAYARLRAHAPETPPLVIAGAKGWYYQAVFDRVRTLGIERHITFAGYVVRGEQPLWYSGAELFVYPSLYEGFGLPVAEALACGTPVITSSVSSLPEAGGRVAVLVAPGDPDRLAHAMRSVLADPGARERVQVEGPRWTQRFSVPQMVAACADAYRDAAALASVHGGKRGR
jgi:glycosyltransferase involved in cell wall biosynthesis